MFIDVLNWGTGEVYGIRVSRIHVGVEGLLILLIAIKRGSKRILCILMLFPGHGGLEQVVCD